MASFPRFPGVRAPNSRQNARPPPLRLRIGSAATAAVRRVVGIATRAASERSTRGNTTSMSSWDDDDDSAAAAEAAATDVELLKRAWRNEKAAPEILRFGSPLVSRVREQIQLLEETLDDSADTGVDDLVVSLYQMDLDRTLFLLRSYLRLRLQKIEKYTMHISRSDDLLSRLSPQERRFAKSCAEIMEKHLEQSVLSKLPYGYDSVTRQSLSSTEDDMVPEPQLDTFVFCKTKSDVGAFQLDDIGEEVVDLVADDLYVLRYKSIKGLVEGGRIDLI